MQMTLWNAIWIFISQKMSYCVFIYHTYRLPFHCKAAFKAAYNLHNIMKTSKNKFNCKTVKASKSDPAGGKELLTSTKHIKTMKIKEKYT